MSLLTTIPLLYRKLDLMGPMLRAFWLSQDLRKIKNQMEKGKRPVMIVRLPFVYSVQVWLHPCAIGYERFMLF